jgi:hypothetical protein
MRICRIEGKVPEPYNRVNLISSVEFKKMEQIQSPLLPTSPHRQLTMEEPLLSLPSLSLFSLPMYGMNLAT